MSSKIKCVYESKSGTHHVKCQRDGSVRKAGCKSDCRFFKRKLTFWERLERWIAKERDF